MRVIGWPANLGRVVLEEADNLGAPQWLPVSATAVENNGFLQVALPAQNAGKFYRLRGD